jgi:hypothetical protein
MARQPPGIPSGGQSGGGMDQPGMRLIDGDDAGVEGRWTCCWMTSCALVS